MRRVWFAVRMGLGALALLLFQTVFWIPGVPLAVKLAFGAFAVLSLLAPRQAMLAVAAFAPLGLILSGLVGLGTARGGEAIVLAFLAGWLLHPRGATGPARVPGLKPGILLVVIIVASCAVWLSIDRFSWSGPTTFVRALLLFLGSRYLDEAGAFRVIPIGLSLVEGVGLLAAVPSLCAGDRRWTRRLLRMSVVGGVGAACSGLLRIALAFVRSAEPLDLLSRLYAGRIRLSLFVPDVNAAGSYFVLVGLLALGGAASSRRSMPLWILGAALAGAGLLLSGSRSAVTAGLLVLLVGSWLLFGWRQTPGPRAIGMTGIAAAVALAILFSSLFPEVMFGRKARRALEMRGAFVETSLRMLASAPVFGVGIGEYFGRSSGFMPSWLRQVYPRENAHNYFLQVAAELGIVGGVLFILTIALPLWRGAQALVASRGDPQLAGIVAGLAAFLATCFSGHPFLHPPIAYAFWTSLGLAVARSDVLLAGQEQAAEPVQRADVPTRRRVRWEVVLALALLLSIPVRARTAIAKLDLNHVSGGFYAWQQTRAGERFRWTGRQAMFYVPSTTRTILVPLGGPPRGMTGGRTEVRLSLDGRIVNQVSLEENEWVTVRMLVPHAPGVRFRRVGLEVFPTWTPDRNRPAARRRIAGIRVGEVELIGAK